MGDLKKTTKALLISFIQKLLLLNTIFQRKSNRCIISKRNIINWIILLTISSFIYIISWFSVSCVKLWYSFVWMYKCHIYSLRLHYHSLFLSLFDSFLWVFCISFFRHRVAFFYYLCCCNFIFIIFFSLFSHAPHDIHSFWHLILFSLVSHRLMFCWQFYDKYGYFFVVFTLL